MNGHPVPGALSRLERRRWLERSRNTERLICSKASKSCEHCRGSLCDQCHYTGRDIAQEAAQ